MPTVTSAQSVSPLLDAVHEIEPVLRAHATDAELERRQPEPVTEAIRSRGLNRMWRPQALGGLEVDPIAGVPGVGRGFPIGQRDRMEPASFDRDRLAWSVVR